MKKLTSLLAFIPILLFAQDISWYNTQSSPYSISTEEELKGFQLIVNEGVDNFENKTVTLAKDIVLTSAWTPIGSSSSRTFIGVFDGKDYTISGLSVSGVQYAGLFGYVGANGQIKNINVVATEIRTSATTANYAGGLAGYYASSNAIENSNVKADSIVSRISATSNSATLNSYSGGLVGYASATLTISNSYAGGNVLANTSTSTNASYYRNSYSGGLVGYAYAAITISNSYASGNVMTASSGSSTASNLNSRAGGLVGYANSTSSISNSYSSGNITATGGSSYSYSGGLVGYATSTATISNSYASGNVSATSYPGGIFGYWSSGTNTSVYYNSAGASRVAGTGSPSGVLGLPSDNLKKQVTFANWDFDNIWRIIDGYSYPYLKIYPPSEMYININENIEIEYISDQTYTGSQITPEPKIRLIGDETLLVNGEHYIFSYETNKNVGTKGSVTITGLGTYFGMEETVYFNIIQKNITIENAIAQNKVYDGTTTATITGTLQGVAENDDVSVTGIFANKNVGVTKAVFASITGSSAANYTFTSPSNLTANITQKPIVVTLDPKTVTIAQSDPISTVSNYIVYNGLVEGDLPSDVSGTTSIYRNETLLSATPAIGTYQITLAGSRGGNYSVSYDNEDLYLKVVSDPINLSTCNIQDISDQIYTGNAIEPPVVIKDGEKTLEEGIDYIIERYINNIYVGTAEIQVKGINLYTGTVNIGFKIFTESKSAPILLPQIANSQINVSAMNGGVLLSNLPSDTKIELYNLQGKQIYLGNSGNSKILQILIQTKGVYIVKAGAERFSVVVK